jgi:hypothetical protein
MDTFPFETWEEASDAAVETGVGYFTFGPGGNTGTYVLVALGFVVMIVILVAWMRFEDERLNEHARRLVAGGDY